MICHECRIACASINYDLVSLLLHPRSKISLLVRAIRQRRQAQAGMEAMVITSTPRSPRRGCALPVRARP